MSNLLNVSPSPHTHGKETTQLLMLNVVIALIPAFITSVFYFGLGAIIVTATSVASCIIFEYIIQKFILKRPLSITDGSALVTGILLGFNLPSNIPVFIIIIGSFVAIAVAKMTFGGLGNNPFNPALVGRVFMLISFPVQMTTWPIPAGLSTGYTDAVTGATPLAIIKEGIKNGEPLSRLMEQIPSPTHMLMGEMGGSIGEVGAIALLIGFAWLLFKKVITWHIPVSVLGTIAVFTAVLWLVNPGQNADPMFHLLAGGVLLGAIFMATDYATNPMQKIGHIIYGIGCGTMVVVIRKWGNYPEGVTYAILFMNCLTPMIDRLSSRRVYGMVKKHV